MIKWHIINDKEISGQTKGKYGLPIFIKATLTNEPYWKVEIIGDGTFNIHLQDRISQYLYKQSMLTAVFRVKK